jgi:hypothetical protein
VLLSVVMPCLTKFVQLEFSSIVLNGHRDGVNAVKFNRYPRRYHPFSRPLALHSSFPAEKLACPPHSLYTIYPTDPDLTIIDSPDPLTHNTAVVTAIDYFAILQKPNSPFPKNDGEVGRRPGKSHKGYVLADVLAWPTEVYKEVQVIYYILSVTCVDNL